MCVGQKAGTTWLWYYLRKNPKIDLGFKKEYHMWSSATIPEYAFLKTVVEEKILKISKKAGQNYSPDMKKIVDKDRILQLSFMNDHEKYFDYFTDKLQSVDITGDFTPEMSGLDVSTLNYIKARFYNVGINTRALFMLRDPVDRLQSMVRMKMIIEDIFKPSYLTELTMMERVSQSKHYYLTGGYDTLIPKFDYIFKQDVYYGFYENLFTDHSTKQITDFLGVSHHQADYNFNPKPSKTDNELLPEDREYFESLYKPIYDYTADRFPQVKNLWTYYQK